MKSLFSGLLTISLILIIFLLAIYLRLSGTYPGYPPYHSDEGISYSAAVSMIKNGNLDPLRYDYPSVTPLSNYIFFKTVFMPATWVKYYVSNLGKIIDGYYKLPLSKVDYERILQLDILGPREVNALTWGRIVTAFFGIGSVVVTYLLSRDLFSKKTAIVTALLVAVNYRLVLNSHFGLPDTYNGFFLILSAFFSFKLYKKPTSKNYLISTVVACLSLATKYQPFSLIPLLLVHLLLSLREKTNKDKLMYLFRKEALIVPLIVAFVFILLNPYAFVNLEQTKVWLNGVSSKYQPGRNMIDVYALSYLFHTGLGQLVTVASLLGLVFSLRKTFFQSIFLLSILVPFFYVTVYYSGAGFYTRNFVTIIPFILIYAGVILSYITSLKFLNRFNVGLILSLIVALFISKDQLWMSRIVASEYTKPWNYEVLSTWLTKNIPEGSKVSAHSSVPLTIKNVERLPYDFNKDFSVSEFMASKADFAIANLDWETNAFYQWMGSIKFFNKPSTLMEETYPAMALRELSDYSIHSVINPWPAPDSDFIVSKIPKLKVTNRKFISAPTLLKQGRDTENLLVKDMDTYTIKKGTSGIEVLSWKSEPIELTSLTGIELTSDMLTEVGAVPEGFLYIKFFNNKEDALNNNNRVAVRLSSRNKADGEWNSVVVASTIINNAKYAVIGFQTYDSALAEVKLRDLKINIVMVEEDLGGWKLNPIFLEDNIIFPISHGYL